MTKTKIKKILSLGASWKKKKKKDGKRTEDVQEISNNCTVITVQTNSIKIVFVVWA